MVLGEHDLVAVFEAQPEPDHIGAEPLGADLERQSGPGLLGLQVGGHDTLFLRSASMASAIS